MCSCSCIPICYHVQQHAGTTAVHFKTWYPQVLRSIKKSLAWPKPALHKGNPDRNLMHCIFIYWCVNMFETAGRVSKVYNTSLAANNVTSRQSRFSVLCYLVNLSLDQKTGPELFGHLIYYCRHFELRQWVSVTGCKSSRRWRCEIHHNSISNAITKEAKKCCNTARNAVHSPCVIEHYQA